MVIRQLTVQQGDDDDYYIELPPEVWDELGWTVGDTVVWTEQPDGSWHIRKQDECSVVHQRL